MIEVHNLKGRVIMKQSGIERMSVSEKLQAIEALWETLGDDIDSPEWHKDLIDERKKLIDSGEARFITLDDLKKITF